MKTQMKFQKWVALASIIIAAVCCVYALIFMTDFAAMANYTSKNNGVEAFKGVDALYNFANTMNGVLFIIAVVFLLVTVTLYITASNKRRNYYVTNYVSVIATAAFAVVVALVGIIIVSMCLAKYSAIDHEAYKELYNTWTSLDGSEIISEVKPTIEGNWSRKYPVYNDSAATLIIGYFVNVLALCVCALNVLNLIWKLKLMKGEKALLQQGFVKEVA